MPILSANSDKPERWQDNVNESVGQYNKWFLEFAPNVYTNTKTKTIDTVKSVFAWTNNLTRVTPDILRQHPDIVQTLRMVTAPPLAQDRLTGLAGVSDNLVDAMENDNRTPPKMDEADVTRQLESICMVLARLIDFDIFPWLRGKRDPHTDEIILAKSIIADRLCGTIADPIIRNEQEKRQLAVLGGWLGKRGYSKIDRVEFGRMRAGTYGYRVNVWGEQEKGSKVKIPVDVVVAPLKSRVDDLPLLVESKSAGDFTNPNKRRKEESDKIANLRRRYGAGLRYVLFLCGYFNTGYLQYEADNQIDWVWEHRVDDFIELGL